MIGHILAVAGIEIRIGVRNRWVLLATLILLSFALALGFLGAAPAGEARAGAMTVTAASLATLSVYLVPLIALLLSFDAVAGEIERGALPLLLATPASRASVIVGKFLGHLAVLALAVTLGYGIAGALVMALSGDGLEGAVALARLIATSIGLGAAFLAIGYVASASVRQTGAAAALAVGVWLAAVVLYDLALLGALAADSEGVFARSVFPWLLVANPADAFRLYNMAALEAGAAATGLGGDAATLPFSPAWALVSLAGWTAAALAAAVAVFRRLEP